MSLLELRFAKYLAGLKNETLTVFPIDEKTRPGNFELHFSPTHNINDCFVVSCAIHCSRSLLKRPRNSLLYSRMLCRFLLLSRFCLSAGAERTPPPRRSRRFEVRKKRTFTYTFLSLTAFKRRLEFWKI